MAGVWASSGTNKCWVQVKEYKDSVEIIVDGVGRLLALSEAHQLADQIREIAHRIEARSNK